MDRLLVFDEHFEPGTTFSADDTFPNYRTGMLYRDNGWESKKIFVANRDERNTVYFEYSFQGAKIVQAATLALLIAQSLLL